MNPIPASPNSPDALADAGTSLARAGRYAEALGCFTQFTNLCPGDAWGWTSLGDVQFALQHATESERSYQRALQLTPDDPHIHEQLSNLLLRVGRVEEALSRLETALELRGRPFKPNPRRLSLLHYSDRLTPEQVFTELAAHGRELESRCGAVAPHENDRSPERLLRIGYVSPDFRGHAVWKWIESLLMHRDRSKFHLVLYWTGSFPDAVTDIARRVADEWRDLSSLTDKDAAEQVRRDRIDILIDLAGQTVEGRLGLFALKPAPIQATYLGSPGTTGLSRIDYLITDSHIAPKGIEQLSTERPFRLPRCFGAFRESFGSPPISPLPADRSRVVTLGSFNFFPKLSPTILRLWSQILRQTPRSRLLIKSWAARDGGVRERLLEILCVDGVEPSRIESAAHSSNEAEHLAQYAQVDILLDTFPYHGTTTTCDALWMGVPVVTLAGKTHVSRTGVSILQNVGLPDLMADSPEAYIRIASTLAADLPRLRSLRQSLRSRMSGSPLCDGKARTRDLERAFRDIWRQYCKSNA